MAPKSSDPKASQQRSKPQRNLSRAGRSGLRHAEDTRQLGCTALFFAIFIITWSSFSSPLSHGLISFSFWLSLFQLSFTGAISTHNAIHAPLFWDPRLNSFYQLCLSLQYGFPVTVFIPGHNLSHHKYPQQAKDFSESMLHYPKLVQVLMCTPSANHQSSLPMESAERTPVLLARCVDGQR
jgi:hypothetical protein